MPEPIFTVKPIALTDEGIDNLQSRIFTALTKYGINVEVAEWLSMIHSDMIRTTQRVDELEEEVSRLQQRVHFLEPHDGDD